MMVRHVGKPKERHNHMINVTSEAKPKKGSKGKKGGGGSGGG